MKQPIQTEQAVKAAEEYTTNPTNIDAYKPAQIARLVEQVGVVKAKLRLGPLFTLAFLAGAFIAFGAAGYTVVMTGADLLHGPSLVLGGLVFSLGLILVIIGGAELFTGNALMVMAAVERRISMMTMLRNWSVVYIGNLVGACAVALAWGMTGTLEGSPGQTATTLVSSKLSLNNTELFFRGVLCNALVCLAVWLSMAARSVSGKILAIVGPITVFVLLGLEHVVANMFFFPQAWSAGLSIDWGEMVRNLLVVTLGNVCGGAGGVALAYHFAYRAGVSNDPH